MYTIHLNDTITSHRGYKLYTHTHIYIYFLYIYISYIYIDVFQTLIGCRNNIMLAISDINDTAKRVYSQLINITLRCIVVNVSKCLQASFNFNELPLYRGTHVTLQTVSSREPLNRDITLGEIDRR